jgi:septum formation protein
MAARIHEFIYLASQSPRRSQLLQQIGVEHRLLLPEDSDDAESLEAVLGDERPDDYVPRVTRLKLHAARRRRRSRGLPEAPILCADTTVALGRRILGKPADAVDAKTMLGALSGRSHRVLTCVGVSHGTRELFRLQVSRVRFAVLPPAVIEAYVASGEPFGKAGAYAVQGVIAGWIEHVEGSHSAIMGLPLYETTELLRRAHVRMHI